MQVNFRVRRWLMQFPPAPPMPLCKMFDANSSMCVCVHVCIYVSMCNLPTPATSGCTSAAAETSRLYVLECPCWFAYFHSLMFSFCWTVLANLLLFTCRTSRKIRRQHGFDWKNLRFGSRFSTSTGEIHFDKLKLLILMILFGICGAKVAPEPRHSKSLQREMWPRSCRNERGGSSLPFNMKTNFDSTWKQIAKTSKTLHLRMCARSNTLHTEIHDIIPNSTPESQPKWAYVKKPLFLTQKGLKKATKHCVCACARANSWGGPIPIQGGPKRSDGDPRAVRGRSAGGPRAIREWSKPAWLRADFWAVLPACARAVNSRKSRRGAPLFGARPENEHRAQAPRAVGNRALREVGLIN